MNQTSSLSYLFIIILLMLVKGCDCNNYDIGKSSNGSFQQVAKELSKLQSGHVSSVDLTKIEELPPVKNKGVVNIGNSCYSNSTIQILASFYRELITHQALDPTNKIAVAGHVLVDDMTGEQEGKDLREMKEKYQNFFKILAQSKENGGIEWVNKRGTQEDADELLTKLFEHFNLPTLKIQYKLVNGVNQQERLVENTEFPSGEPFNKLALAISKGTIGTMQDAVNDFFSPEQIDDYKWDGKTSTPTQKIPILKDLDKLYNKVLVVSLKRYELDIATGRTLKIDKPIEQPFRINLKQEQIAGKQEDFAYELAGFIKHEGEGTGSGHYIAYVKVNKTWIKYNDSQVEEVTERQAETEAKRGYTFFYQQAKPK